MDLIEQKLNLESEKCRSLWKEIKTVVEACKHHLTQITAQMPDYDGFRNGFAEQLESRKNNASDYLG